MRDPAYQNGFKKLKVINFTLRYSEVGMYVDTGKDCG